MATGTGQPRHTVWPCETSRTGTRSTVEVITKRFAEVTVKDEAEGIISVACWNIMGEATAELRKKVVSLTFERTRDLLQADIICLQEVPVMYPGKKFQEYVPVSDSLYGSAVCKEPGGSKYNVVLYKEEKFTLLDKRVLDDAFFLMEVKRVTYDTINRGGTTIKQKAIKKKLKLSDLKKTIPESHHIDEILEEVLQECAKCGQVAEFDELLSRYKVPSEHETKPPRKLLLRRVAMTLLEKKTTTSQKTTTTSQKTTTTSQKTTTTSHGPQILVISIHSYGKRSGANSTERLNYLLFDFLEKLPMSGLNCSVLLAGDFNQDIYSARSIQQFLPQYIAPNYRLTSLRRGQGCIDFILLRQANPPAPQFLPFQVTAIDFIVPRVIEEQLTGYDRDEKHRKITNHSPLTATLEF